HPAAPRTRCPQPGVPGLPRTHDHVGAASGPFNNPRQRRPSGVIHPLYSPCRHQKPTPLAHPFRLSPTNSSTLTPSNSTTFLSIKFLTSRNSSGGISFGSGISHAMRRFALTKGHSSPQPIVTAASKSRPLNSPSPFDSCCVKSYPTSFIASIALGL